MEEGGWKRDGRGRMKERKKKGNNYVSENHTIQKEKEKEKKKEKKRTTSLLSTTYVYFE